MKQFKWSVILLALLLAAMVMVPIVSAASDLNGKIVRVSATKEQVDTINKLWGKDITAGEYFAQVHPELLNGIPDDLRAALYKKKWIWPSHSATEVAKPNSLLLVPISCQGQAHAHPAVIHFSGMAQYTGGTPYYMAFATYLVDSSDTVKASTAASGFSVTYLNSENMWQPLVSGMYHTHTTAFSISPDYDAVPYFSSPISWP